MAAADPTSEPRPDASPPFPGTRGERLFVAALVASPCGLLVGAVTGWAAGAPAGGLAGAACAVAVTAYAAAFLRPDPVPEGEPARRCAWCGAGFDPRQANQRYCAPPCRRRATAARRTRRADRVAQPARRR